MGDRKKGKPPSIEVKSGYVHMGVVNDMLKKRESVGVLPIGVVTNDKVSQPAKDKLDSLDIAWAEIPESEIRAKEDKEKE
ncbi:hypothetical protein [Aliivibrio wodanis]|uniref:hypothetical protein n=1 Tax=Aliivibrio wodanis TaxID=80852 RepID=UPI00406C9156